MSYICKILQLLYSFHISRAIQIHSLDSWILHIYH